MAVKEAEKYGTGNRGWGLAASGKEKVKSMARIITLSGVRVGAIHVYYDPDANAVELIADYVLLASDGNTQPARGNYTMPLTATQKNTLKTFLQNQVIPGILAAEGI